MIITAISAKNVLKYAGLELSELPPKGVIAISGPNESGKSTIGETVCFALFGRTFSVGPQDVDKIIRWGESSCRVSCSFTVDDGQHYEIARFLDADGTHSARLNRVGEEEEPMARGVAAVDDALYGLIGYDFDEFVDSFYLAQREITAPHAHSHTVKAMAGIAPLEYVADELAEETDDDLRLVAETDEDIADLDRQLGELAIDEGRLAALQDEREETARRGADAQSRLQDLEVAAAAYRDGLAELKKVESRRGRNRFLTFVVFLFAVALGAAWGALARMPDHPLSRSLEQMLGQYVPQWSEAQLPVLLYAAAGLALLWLLLAARGMGLKGRARRLAERGRDLAARLDVARSTSVPSVEGPDWQVESSPDAEVDESTLEGLGEPDREPSEEPPGGVERLSDERFAAGRDRVAESLAGQQEADELVDSEASVLRRTVQVHEAALLRLDQALSEEKDRRERAGQLGSMKTALGEKTAARRRRIEIRELAQDLLAGAGRHMSQRFNHDLRTLVGRTLPLFTDGRYEHLQIDRDLEVRVFSSDKRDYMDLDEISSGTQRQIMLALRLALSQELVNSAVLGSQFVFLDEPFAFFDDERTRTSLKVLPQISDEISQVWIVSQEFPPDASFDRHVRCARDLDRLQAAG